MKMHKYNNYDKEFDSPNHLIYVHKGDWNPLMFINKKEGSFTIQGIEIGVDTFSLLNTFNNKDTIEFEMYFNSKHLRKGIADEE